MRKRLLLLAAVIAALGFGAGAMAFGSLGGSAFPLTYITSNPINMTEAFNNLLGIINTQTTGISTTYAGAMAEPSAGADTSGTVFSTNIQQNPLIQQSYNDVPTDVILSGLTSSAMTTLIASEAGRKIIPAGALQVMVSGTAGTATGIAIECQDGALLASWLISDLVTNVPVTAYGNGTAPGVSSSLIEGCLASKAIMISNVGTNLTTTTHIYVNMPYTVQ